MEDRSNRCESRNQTKKLTLSPASRLARSQLTGDGLLMEVRWLATALSSRELAPAKHDENRRARQAAMRQGGSKLPHSEGRHADDWYSIEKFEKDLAFLREVTEVTTCVFEGGHEWTDEFRDAVGKFLGTI